MPKETMNRVLRRLTNTVIQLGKISPFRRNGQAHPLRLRSQSDFDCCAALVLRAESL
jgi:hypothetical protein